MSRRPNLFIAGAPKCGTTALYEYLRGHPLVYMSPVKELHHFGRDLHGRRFVRDEQAYLAHFAGATDELWVGEGSIFSMFSRTAAREIRDAAPDARILVMLRHPVELIHSLHSQYLWTGNEDITDLAEALDAEADRRDGRRIPSNAHFAQGLQYRRMAALGEQLGRLLDVFGDAVHVLLIDDVRADEAAALHGILAFLELPYEASPTLPVVNENKRVRSRVLHRTVKGLASTRAADGLRRSIPAPVAGRLERAADAAMAINARNSPRAPMHEDLRVRLIDELAGEVRRLEQLLQRDLTHWLTTASSGR